MPVGAAGAAIVAGKAFVEPALAQKGLLSSNGVFAAAATAIADLVYIEAFPTSPLILEPFKDQLTIPKAMRRPRSRSTWAGRSPPGPATASRTRWATSGTRSGRASSATPDPIVYKIDVRVATHSFTTSQVLPIDKNGKPAVSFDADRQAATPPAPSGRCRPARSTASTAPSPAR